MSWRDLLQTETEETVVYPWVGGRSLQTFNRTWKIEGRLPREHGWHEFIVSSRTAKLKGKADAGELKFIRAGYLVGDRFLCETAEAHYTLKDVDQLPQAHLIDPGLDRFARVLCGLAREGGQLVFKEETMPLGPEEAVVEAFEDRAKHVKGVKGVVPALELAFAMATYQRKAEEKRRKEEQERREKEERRQRIIDQLGDGAGRREAAKENFGEAAKAALAIGGATYLDHRNSTQKDEVVVRYRLDERRLECTCNALTLNIIDAGICLTAHYDDPDFDGGTKGDTWLSLETLPGVIREAIREGKLVVWRHA